MVEVCLKTSHSACRFRFFIDWFQSISIAALYSCFHCYLNNWLISFVGSYFGSFSFALFFSHLAKDFSEAFIMMRVNPIISHRIYAHYSRQHTNFHHYNNNNEDDDDLSTQTWAEFLIDSGYSYKKSFILSQTFIVFYFANSLSIYFLCKNFISKILNYITVIKSAVRSTRLQSKKFPSLLFHLIMHN